ncbi:MAG TPA: right-handed parallel beta-helix repeat-containing protein [Stellaceae bacterium]|nr:right-handed parallel beta-helix repeat-containing protein [Stellaceae bacterium]
MSLLHVRRVTGLALMIAVSVGSARADTVPAGQPAQSAVDTVAALRAVTGSAGQLAMVRALDATGPGRGVFFWNVASTAADDGAGVVNPTGHSGAGRWQHLTAGQEVPVTAFGAAPGQDDTAAFTAAFAAVNAVGGGTVFVPPADRPYIISPLPTIPIYSNTLFRGAKGKSVIQMDRTKIVSNMGRTGFVVGQPAGFSQVNGPSGTGFKANLIWKTVNGVSSVAGFPDPYFSITWAPATPYAKNAYANAHGGIYQATTAGVSAPGGGPSGTGSDVADGTVVWKYLQPFTVPTIVDGGTNYKPGDTVYVGKPTARGDAGASLDIQAVVSYRGAIARVSIGRAGQITGEAPTNPTPQDASTGRSPQDYFLKDISKVATNITVDGLVFDGGYGSGNPSPAPDFRFKATLLTLENVNTVAIAGCEFRYGLSSPLYINSFTSASVKDSYFHDNGVFGFPGSARNGLNAVGRYQVNNPALDVKSFVVTGNRFDDNKDVGLQFTLIRGGVFTKNTFSGNGAIGIEGEASSYKMLDTRAANGGVEVPSEVLIEDNEIDGRSKSSPQAPVTQWGLDGISTGAGNEGTITLRRNKLHHLQRYAILATQPNDGFVDLENNTIDTVGSPATANFQAVFLVVGSVHIDGMVIRNVGVTPILATGKLVSADFKNIKIEGNTSPHPAIAVSLSNGQGKTVAFSDIDIAYSSHGGIWIEGADYALDQLSFKNVKAQNFNVAGDPNAAAFAIVGKGSKYLSVEHVVVDGLTATDGTRMAQNAINIRSAPNAIREMVVKNSNLSGGQTAKAPLTASPAIGKFSEANNR